MKIHEIPGKLSVNWDAEAHAVVDTWSTYFVSLEEFKDAVLIKGVNFAKTHGAKAWIVDSSQAKGVFSPEIQDLIGKEVFPAFAKINIKYFITVTSQSAATKLSISAYTSKLGPNGIKLVEATSAKDAIEWLKKNA